MTEKQQNILQAALMLFAKEGYHATSTSKVANAAGVSEGLIFRHFENKEGLLQAILEFGTDKFKELMIDVVMESDPKEVIRKTINMPLQIDKSDYDFWRLQFKLKWELEINGDEKMEPLRMALTNAFKKLDYEAPETEAQLILIFMDGIGSSMLKGSNIDPSEIIELLLKKHNL